jgi:RNA methyltransferase, TrmH family
VGKNVNITSVHNPKVKRALRLRERRERDETHLFLIEGYRELRRAVDGGVRIALFFYCPSFFLGSNEKALIAAIEASGAESFCCDPQVFEKLSYRDRPDGLIAVAHQMQKGVDALFLSEKKDPFLVIAEAIEKPGNLGTILRSADAAGADAVIVCDRCTDIYNPNVVRASVGTLFTLPVVEASSDEVIAVLLEKKIRIVAATPRGEREFTQADLRGAVALAVGTEQLGLSERWMRAAQECVRIPMHGAADSLNVATATTLLLYEILRQRR